MFPPPYPPISVVQYLLHRRTVIIIQSAAENRATIRFESQSDEIYEMSDWTAFHLNLTEAVRTGFQT
jgi:hypothetical protein|eukprot:COSAG06_NODE_347_length_17007_cov_379.165306_14_plen_67_part_00